MAVRYFDWTQEHGADEPIPPVLWYLEMALPSQNERALRHGRLIEQWDPATTALCDDANNPTDFPVTSNDIPVYFSRLANVMREKGVEEVQLLPVRVKQRHTSHEILGYYVANYLRLIDCLDRERSIYQVWTKENLLFWEKRPWMLGTFRDVQRAVLDVAKIGSVPVFRLWGWEVMVIVREDLKRAVEEAGITGCRFTEVETTQ